MVGYGCTTCIGNSGPLPDADLAGHRGAATWWSSRCSRGNRNFEGRINPDVRANYLASPPLVVAYALAGRIDIDLARPSRSAPARTASRSSCKDIWPTPQEVERDRSARPSSPRCSASSYGDVFAGDEHWHGLDVPEGDTYAWDPAVDLRPAAAVLRGHAGRAARRSSDIHGARVLAVLGDSITTDHISPAGSIKADSPAGKYLIEHGVAPEDFNSYGARRGNHEVMMRGTFANIRLRNLLVPGTEGGVTRHLPDGEPMSIYDAAMKYKAEGVPLGGPRRQGVRHRLVPRLGGQGAAAAGRARRDRRELRAHPPQQPGRHGRAAAGVHGRARPRRAWG